MGVWNDPKNSEEGKNRTLGGIGGQKSSDLSFSSHISYLWLFYFWIRNNYVHFVYRFRWRYWLPLSKMPGFQRRLPMGLKVWLVNVQKCKKKSVFSPEIFKFTKNLCAERINFLTMGSSFFLIYVNWPDKTII